MTSHKIMVTICGLFVCLLAYYSKSYEWILMKFSGKTEDGTSNEPLNFVAICGLGIGFALSKCNLRAKACAHRVLLVYHFFPVFVILEKLLW